MSTPVEYNTRWERGEPYEVRTKRRRIACPECGKLRYGYQSTEEWYPSKVDRRWVWRHTRYGGIASSCDPCNVWIYDDADMGCYVIPRADQ